MRKKLFSFLLFASILPFFFYTNYYKGPISDHFNGSNFYNPWNPHKHSFFSILKWRMTSTKEFWPESVENTFSDTPPKRVEGNNLRVTFIGHSTFLIQTQGLNILTDPVWSELVGPFSWLSIKRVAKPGIPFEQLPKIDIVLISHNHYDHMDLPTLDALWKRDMPLIFAPIGNDTLIHNEYPSMHVETLDWGECKNVQQTIDICLEPTQHWSRRGLWDRDKALWGAYAIKTLGGNIYFAGDTGYSKEMVFEKAYEKYGSFRLAILPIGSYKPRWFMAYSHLNPEEAVQAHLDLKAHYSVAAHFKTFPLADEAYDAPVKELEKAKQERGIEDFKALEIGESWTIPFSHPDQS